MPEDPFLFLYGLERRLLQDLKTNKLVSAEVPALINEIRALIEIYGNRSGSFLHYATDLVDAVTLPAIAADYLHITPPTTNVGWDYPLQLKIALGCFARDGHNLSPEWALAWTRCNPVAPRRVANERCAAEISSLFRLRYLKAYPNGVKIKPGQARLTSKYRPSSPSLREVEILLPDLPDVTTLAEPLDDLMKLAEIVQNDLYQYSRQLGQGKYPGSIPALAMLPVEIQESELSGAAKAVVNIVESGLVNNEMASIRTSDIVPLYPAKTPGKLSKQEASILSMFLEKRGYCIEPDCRYGGLNLASIEHCVVYRLNGLDETPGDAFRAATVLLSLGVAVAKADGEVTVDEQKNLEQQMESTFHLSKAERKRLAAHLQWLLVESPTLSGAKSRIQELDEKQKHSVGQFLISIAAADGRISPNEIKILSKLYPLLGLNPESVYSDLHSLTVSDQGPVTVVRAEEKSKSYSIPQQADQLSGSPGGTINLDAARIAAIREKSTEAAALLSNVFVDADHEPAEEGVEADISDSKTIESSLVSGLDRKHSAFVQTIAEQERWSRADFDQLAKRYDILPGGALEAINETAFKVCGEALLEGEDPIEVNQYAKKELLP